MYRLRKQGGLMAVTTMITLAMGSSLSADVSLTVFGSVHGLLVTWDQETTKSCSDRPGCHGNGTAGCTNHGCSVDVHESAKDERQELPVNSNREDRDIFHFLLEHHKEITRTVKNLDNGVETLTESSNPDIVEKLQEHVFSMKQRVENGRPIRRWDSLFQEIFGNAESIEMTVEKTENGVKVVETSSDPFVTKLIQAHAKAVSGFVEHGFAEARKNHEPPKK